jgi:hypothetical protein
MPVWQNNCSLGGAFYPMHNMPLPSKKHPFFYFLAILLYCISPAIHAQINYSANDAGRVPAYNSYFLYGSNMGYYGPSWDNVTKANIASGNPALNIKGAGVKSFRVPLPEEFMEFWGMMWKSATLIIMRHLALRTIRFFWAVLHSSSR